MIAIAIVALWGWVAGGWVLVLTPILAALFILAEAVAWWRARSDSGQVPDDEWQDPLTGLPTRKKLARDVAAFLDVRGEEDAVTLAVIDLVGYKKYNDAFGYAAGDALLRHLSARVVETVGDRGDMYRLRGPQFCLATTLPRIEANLLRLEAARALSVVGEGFAVHAAWGAVAVPTQAASLAEALKLADQEVQADRAELRHRGIDETAIAPTTSAGGLAPSPHDVAGLIVTVGEALGLDRDGLNRLHDAATWRDVGMMAVPDAIVHAKGELTSTEHRFIELHTLIGERLLRANFGLDEAAGIVRSTHERWDGDGYPDRLTGDETPLEARIVAACAAFQDMTAPRPHRPAMTARQALEELRAGAGTQFDREVVGAIESALGEAARTAAVSHEA